MLSAFRPRGSAIARSILIFLAGAFLSLLALAPHAAGSSNGSASLPCFWHRTLTNGFPEGKVVARFLADCRKYAGGGTLTIDVRLFKLSAKGKTWTAVGTQTKSWSDFSRPRDVQLIVPCKRGQYRATFSATLRSAGGAVVGTVNVKAPPIDVIVGCTVHLI
jgi:rhodanese-related sulfurtransferase